MKKSVYFQVGALQILARRQRKTTDVTLAGNIYTKSIIEYPFIEDRGCQQQALGHRWAKFFACDFVVDGDPDTANGILEP